MDIHSVQQLSTLPKKQTVRITQMMVIITQDRFALWELDYDLSILLCWAQAIKKVLF